MQTRRGKPAIGITRHHGIAGKPEPVACFWGKTTKAMYGVALKASCWPRPVERPVTYSTSEQTTGRYALPPAPRSLFGRSRRRPKVPLPLCGAPSVHKF